MMERQEDWHSNGNKTKYKKSTNTVDMTTENGDVLHVLHTKGISNFDLFLTSYFNVISINW